MKARSFLSTVVLFTIAFNFKGQSEFEWIRQGGGNLNDRGYGLVVDANDHIILTGVAEDECSFGAGILNANAADILLAKYTNEGIAVWSKLFGSDGIQDAGLDVCVDSENAIYLTGNISGVGQFDEFVTSYADGTDGFVSKVDGDGNVLWVKTINGTTDETSNGICIDPQGNVYMTGMCITESQFDNYEVTQEQGFSGGAYVAKYSNLGEILWVKVFGSEYFNEGMDIACDDSGFIYATGIFTDYLYADDNLLTNPGTGRAPYVICLSENSDVVWATAPDPQSYSHGTKIDAVPGGGCVITGFFQSGISFQNDMVQGQGDEDVFVARYDSNGTLVWFQTFGSTMRDRAFGVCIDENENVFVSGYFESAITMDNETITSSGTQDAFIMKFDSAGQFLGMHQAGSTTEIPMGYEECSFAVDTDSNDDCIATGIFKGNAQFGTETMESYGLADLFVVKIGVASFITNTSNQPSTLLLYPNPSSDFIYVNSVMTNSKINLFDMTGRRLRSYSGNTVFVGDLASGSYFLQFETTKAGIQTAQFIKP